MTSKVYAVYQCKTCGRECSQGKNYDSRGSRVPLSDMEIATKRHKAVYGCESEGLRFLRLAPAN